MVAKREVRDPIPIHSSFLRNKELINVVHVYGGLEGGGSRCGVNGTPNPPLLAIHH